MSVGMIRRLSPVVYERGEIPLELDLDRELADVVAVARRVTLVSRIRDFP